MAMKFWNFSNLPFLVSELGSTERGRGVLFCARDGHGGRDDAVDGRARMWCRVAALQMVRLVRGLRWFHIRRIRRGGTQRTRRVVHG